MRALSSSRTMPFVHAQFPTKGQNLALAQRAGIFLCVFWLEEQGPVLQEQFSFFLFLDTAQAMQTGLCALHRIVDLRMVKPKACSNRDTCCRCTYLLLKPGNIHTSPDE